MSRRSTSLVAAALAMSACSAALGADIAPRHCVLLAAEYESQGKITPEITNALRVNVRVVQARLLLHMQADRLVANTFFVDADDRYTTRYKMHKTRAITGCDTVVEIRSVFWSSMIGGAFGYDLVVQRATGAGDTLVSAYERQYRYGLDKATLNNFSYEGFGEAAWADLRRSAFLDVDREAVPLAEPVIRAEYDRAAAAWPAKLPEYHLRRIRLETEQEAIATISKLHEQDPPDFAALAADSSNDGTSAAKGGDIGWLAASSMPPEIAGAVRERAGNPGLIDHPIHAEDGWHVIEVLGERSSHPPPFAEVSDRLAAMLRWNAVVPPATWTQALQP